MKKILIIGGTGFFGYHLCKNFLKLRFKVFSLSKFKPTRIRKLTSVKYLFGDISKIKSSYLDTINQLKNNMNFFDDSLSIIKSAKEEK